jgi:UDP:flavonoid glycosyltransferase YjiC (YdhE family)
MARFLFYVSPAVGHTLPLVPGLLELRSRGHAVHVRGLPSLVPVLQDLGLDASPVDARVVEVPVTDYRATSDADRLKSGQVDLIARGRFDGPDLDDAMAAFRPDAVLVDVNAYGAQTRAEASGLPRALLTPSVVPLPGARIPAYGLGMAPMHGPVGALRDRVLWKVVERMFARAMVPGLNGLRADAGLGPISSPLDLWSSPDAVIALTGPPLEYPRTDLPANVHLVGTRPWDVPQPRPAYLDEPGDPWVLVTCSTEYQGDQRLAEVAAAALADEPVRVLLTMADAYDAARTSDLLLDLPANVRVERFVPHGHVLPEAAAVVCHGGLGIVNRAVTAGVPTVVVPFGRDQPEIARRVAEAGAGVTVSPKKLTPDRLRAAVRQAMTMKESAGLAARLTDPAGAPARFADAVLTLVGDRDGASTTA